MIPFPETIKVFNSEGKEITLEVFLEGNDSLQYWIFRHGEKTFTWQNDIPLLKATASRKQPKWQIAHSEFFDAAIFANALDKIKHYIKEKESGGFEAHQEYWRNKKR